MGQGTNHEPDKQVPITVIARYAHLLSPFRPTGDIDKDGQLVQIPFPDQTNNGSFLFTQSTGIANVEGLARILKAAGEIASLYFTARPYSFIESEALDRALILDLHVDVEIVRQGLSAQTKSISLGTAFRSGNSQEYKDHEEVMDETRGQIGWLLSGAEQWLPPKTGVSILNLAGKPHAQYPVVTKATIDELIEYGIGRPATFYPSSSH